jgi:PhnB protein
MKTANQKKSVKAIPDGFRSVTPFIIAEDAAKFIDFITAAFDAKTTYVLKRDDSDTIAHATVTIGDSIIMIGEAGDKMQPTPSMLYIYVENVDAVYNKAIQAKGISIREPLNEFYGDRSAGIKDAWGQ